VRLRVRHSAALGELLSVGASLAVSGVCLTVIEHACDESLVELSPETLRRTTLGGLRAGSEVNLEPALRVGDALGGHWVQGHVDGIGRITGARRDAGDARVTIDVPENLRRFVASKGSITVDGVSLTVNSVEGGRFEVNLIPHTLSATTLRALRAGSRVNVEVDLLARYVDRLLQK